MDFTIEEPSAQKWRVQLAHAVAIEADVEYSICYSAKAEGSRYLEVNVDTAASEYRGLMGTGFTPEVGAAIHRHHPHPGIPPIPPSIH